MPCSARRWQGRPCRRQCAGKCGAEAGDLLSGAQRADWAGYRGRGRADALHHGTCRAKRAYEKVRSALEQVEATGYGIVMPSIDELHLEPPEIVHQDGRCGVRLQACAPSIQMMKATIHTELSPIVGTEKQSEDLVQSLLADFADDPVQLWESNIFGKSLHELVNDGLQNKLLHIPQEARTRLQETLERVINEGCTGLICILI